MTTSIDRADAARSEVAYFDRSNVSRDRDLRQRARSQRLLADGASVEVMGDPVTPPALSPELVAELEALGESLALRPDHADLARKLEWLIDALILRGQLPASFKKLAGKVRSDRSTVRLSMFRDKYAVTSSDIDCAARIPLCGARCCTFDVTLSAQDVAEQKLPFVIDEPYMLPRDRESRRCVCMDDAGACTVYDHRPGACRAYDCRGDDRVWIDFEARIPAPR